MSKCESSSRDRKPKSTDSTTSQDQTTSQEFLWNSSTDRILWTREREKEEEEETGEGGKYFQPGFSQWRRRSGDCSRHLKTVETRRRGPSLLLWGSCIGLNNFFQWDFTFFVSVQVNLHIQGGPDEPQESRVSMRIHPSHRQPLQ